MAHLYLALSGQEHVDGTIRTSELFRVQAVQVNKVSQVMSDTPYIKLLILSIFKT